MIKLLLTAPKQHRNASNNAAIPPATWSSYPPLFSSMRSLDPTPPTRVCRQWSPLKTQVWVHFPPTPLCLLVKTAGGQLSSVLLLRLAILERPCKQASLSVHFRQRLYQILRVHTIWLSNVNTRIKNMTDTRLKTHRGMCRQGRRIPINLSPTGGLGIEIHCRRLPVLMAVGVHTHTSALLKGTRPWFSLFPFQYHSRKRTGHPLDKLVFANQEQDEGVNLK